jgi:prepilin peptidase CpaA
MKNVSIAVFSRYALGILAMAMAMLFIYFYRNSFSILAASAYLFLICATDTIYSKIPNIFTVIFITVGFLTNIIISGLPGVLFSVTGFIVGIALLLIPFLMGGMGAGDVKALAALGAFLGPSMTFHIFLYMGCIGGLLGLFFHILLAPFQSSR